MKRPVIYFDWDGTIGDSMDLCIAEVSTALKRLGYPVPEEAKIRLCNGPTIRESAPMLGIRPEDVEAYYELRTQLEIDLVPAYQKLFPGMDGVLRRLMERADLAIVSQGFDGYIRASLRACGVEDCFVRIQAAVPGRTKTENLRRMLEDMQPPRAAMIGDRRGDIVAGLDNHLATYAATFGFGAPEEFEGAVVCDTVEALEKTLNDWLDET